MLLKNSLNSTAAALRAWNVFTGLKQGSVQSAKLQYRPCMASGRCYGDLTWIRRSALTCNESVTNLQVRQYARAVRKKQEFQSQLQDLPPTMLKLDYASVPLAHTVDDVVKKLLSLELASHSERLRLKEEQLIAKVQRRENDRTSAEVKVAILTARIRNFQEHLQKHPKDKANKRWMLMSIDRRKKMLKFLRRTRYDAFEKVCAELGITYTFPPEYYRRATRRWLAKKALCIKVFKEVQKQKAEKRNKMNPALAQKSKSTSSDPTDTQTTEV
ncbi:small ribosomal subunit protein uS15m [Trichomycterus rosablanca]|uniref:small ribosomal subunit protein uS15m n=1 Tax=Trichomycterus rosablanca TaxID=2290929 RepID=UPI002F360742